MLYVGMLQKSVQVNRKILATPSIHYTVQYTVYVQCHSTTYNMQDAAYSINCIYHILLDGMLNFTISDFCELSEKDL